jgi:hypothetical protein
MWYSVKSVGHVASCHVIKLSCIWSLATNKSVQHKSLYNQQHHASMQRCQQLRHCLWSSVVKHAVQIIVDVRVTCLTTFSPADACKPCYLRLETKYNCSIYIKCQVFVSTVEFLRREGFKSCHQVSPLLPSVTSVTSFDDAHVRQNASVTNHWRHQAEALANYLHGHSSLSRCREDRQPFRAPPAADVLHHWRSLSSDGQLP